MPEPQRADCFGEDRPIGIEFRKSFKRRVLDGFMDRYLSGHSILDIGYRGGDPLAVPITRHAIGVELDYPGYDGIRLPFGDGSQDAVLASHVLEHIPDYRTVLADWYRVLRPGGYLVLFLPHKYLYEKRPDIPSRWNGEHRRFYTPASLLREVEDSLPCNGYRVRHLVENDVGFNYDDAVDALPSGCYEIELVVEKIVRPSYSDSLEYSPVLKNIITRLDQLIIETVAEALKGEPAADRLAKTIGRLSYFTPWRRLEAHFVFAGAPELDNVPVTTTDLEKAVRPLLEFVDIDNASYLQLNGDLTHSGVDPVGHWRLYGYFEGRTTRGYQPDYP